MTDQEIVQKYKDRIYTQEGKRNIKTITSIAKIILPSDHWSYPGPPVVTRSSFGEIAINDDIIDLNGDGRENEILNVIEFCKWLKGKYYTD